jgi:predicted murein hydrolase (TIGR00659 family)
MNIYEDPLFGAAVTVGAYALARLLHRRFRFLHPLFVCSLGLIALLLALDIPYDAYNEGGRIVSFFLGPATVALGVPLYKQWPKVRARLLAVLGGVTAGSVSGIVLGGWLAWALGGTKEIIYSMMPKTVTSPVSLEIADRLGGIPELAATLTVLSGLLGSMFGPELLRLCGVRADLPLGTAIGTTSHGIGTARLLAESEAAGGISSFCMAAAAIVTPMMFVPVYWLLL